MIKNRNELLSHGLISSRKIVLDILDDALAAVDPRKSVTSKCKINKRNFYIEDDFLFNLDEIDDIYVVGAGKATYRMALGLNNILGDKIKEGIIAVKFAKEKEIGNIKIVESSHPFPDKRSLRVSREIFRICKKAKEKDVVFCLISGGSSALCVSPVSGITFEEKAKMHRDLVCCGADIYEINTVRRHLSSIKGGWLTLDILPARIVTLAVSDAVGDEVAINTDWTSPDPTTIQDAINVLKKHDLWKKTSKNIRRYLEDNDSKKETPKKFHDIPLSTYLLIKTRTICETAFKKAKKMGFRSLLLSTFLNGESKEIGKTLAAIIKEIKTSKNPIESPCILIAGGESTIKLSNNRGLGGPNQELVLSSAINLKNENKFVIASIDSDGSDGPTNYAGSIIDECTRERADKLGILLDEELKNNNDSYVFSKLKDLIITGSTGTNVNDLIVILLI